MTIAKKVALALLSPLFIVLLYATAFDIGFTRIATHSDNVKKLVAESGIYSSVVPSLLQQTKSISTSVGSIDTSSPLIQKAANQAITPAYIQQNSEAVIDSVYKWLDGDTAQPDFSINLGEVKNNFATQVAANAQQQLAGLPTCTTQAQVVTFNALNATCLPRGTTPASAGQLLQADLSSNQDFIDQTTLSAANLKSSDGQSVFTGQLKNAPKQYQRAKKTPWILSILTVLCGIGIIFTSPTWPKGLRHIGVYLVFVGVLMMLFAYFFNREVGHLIVPKVKLDSLTLQTDLRKLITDLTSQIDRNYWFFGVLYSVLGAITIAAAEVFRRRAQEPSKPAVTGVTTKKP